MSDLTADGTGEHILVTDDDRAFRLATKTLLEDAGYVVNLAAKGEEALHLLEREECDLLLSDLVMSSMSGIELLRAVRAAHPDLPVLMVTGFGSVETAVEAMKLGATDYLTKPANHDELLLKIRRALNSRNRDRELQRLRDELQSTYSFGNIVTRSPKMREVLLHVQQVADTDLTILLRGESGTGKELVARGLHFSSKRKNAPFVAVNCSALPETLLESELFGYERGAFTGAVRQRQGKFEDANTGTLFLDEIGELPAGVQAKLLRVLQERSFERVGGNRAVSVDVRVVAATNRNLETMIAQGDFREDLYYRLNVFPIVLPPLRERPEDIVLLAEYFLRRHADLSAGRVRAISPHVLSAMMNYPWRGNVRELENLIKRALVKTEGDTIERIELQEDAPATNEEPPPAPSPQMPYKEYLSAVLRTAEERYLLRMLRDQKGNINQIARLMDVDRKTVYRKLADYGIDPAPYRA
jgi:two-component system response regulator AtoC